jgi:hypothetical protein
VKNCITLSGSQSAAQAQRESRRPTTPSRVTVLPPEAEEQSERSFSSVDTRLKVLEAELKALRSLRIEGDTSHHTRHAAEVTSSIDPPEIRLEAFPAIINPDTIRNKRFTDVLAVKTYHLVDKNEKFPYDQSMSLTQVANQIRPRMEGYFSGEHTLQCEGSSRSSPSQGCKEGIHDRRGKNGL